MCVNQKNKLGGYGHENFFDATVIENDTRTGSSIALITFIIYAVTFIDSNQVVEV